MFGAFSFRTLDRCQVRSLISLKLRFIQVYYIDVTLIVTRAPHLREFLCGLCARVRLRTRFFVIYGSPFILSSFPSLFSPPPHFPILYALRLAVIVPDCSNIYAATEAFVFDILCLILPFCL